MWRPRPLLAAVLLLAGSSRRENADACPLPGYTLADMVEAASTIVVGEVVALHDVAGERVAEVRVVDLLEGEVLSGTLFYPVRYVSWDAEEEPKVGERAVLLLEPDFRFEGTRAFWKAVDGLRAGRPFLNPVPYDLARLPVRRMEDGGEGVLLRASLELPVGVGTRLVGDGDPELAPRAIDLWALVDAIRGLVERPGPADPSSAGQGSAPGMTG